MKPFMIIAFFTINPVLWVIKPVDFKTLSFPAGIVMCLSNIDCLVSGILENTLHCYRVPPWNPVHISDSIAGVPTHARKKTCPCGYTAWSCAICRSIHYAFTGKLVKKRSHHLVSEAAKKITPPLVRKYQNNIGSVHLYPLTTL